jgi:WD40 repeat protein
VSGSKDGTIAVWLLLTNDTEQKAAGVGAFQNEGPYLTEPCRFSTGGSPIFSMEVMTIADPFAPDAVRSLLFSGGGKSGDGVIQVWSIGSGADMDGIPRNSGTDAEDAHPDAMAERKFLVSNLSGHSHMVFALSGIGIEGVIASASMDTTVRLWDVVNNTCLSILQGQKSWIIPSSSPLHSLSLTPSPSLPFPLSLSSVGRAHGRSVLPRTASRALAWCVCKWI